MSFFSSRQPGAFHGWHVLATCTASQFFAMGCTMYLIGLFIEPLSRAWAVTPGTIGAAGGVFAVSGSLMAPILGHWSDKGQTKRILVAGAALLGAGFMLLAQTKTIVQGTLVSVVCIAPAVAMLGAIPTTVMVAQWFEKRRGLAIGITAAGISGGGFVMPMLVAWLLENVTWQQSLMVLGGLIWLILLPMVLLFATHKPSELGQHPDGVAPAENAPRASSPQTILPLKRILTSRNFWLISVAVGIMSFLGLLMVTYIAPYGKEIGMSLRQAAFMISLYSICGVAGKFLLGWLCDKLQPQRMLTITLLLVTAGWIPMLFLPQQGTFLITACVVGFANGGMIPVWSSLIAIIFGLENFGRVRGIMSLALVLFTMLPGPLGGYLRDISGTYATAFTALWYLLPLGIFASLWVKPDTDHA